MKRLNLSKVSDEHSDMLQEVQLAVQACQRCIIITGAGISVSSGIPDFRSPEGLFQQLKQKYPNAVTNGKDLFDATLFSDPAMISVFYNFMGELRNLVSQANCTPTHRFIKELEENGKLLRCYTQNIDSLEKRIGLETSFQRPASLETDDSASSPTDCSSQLSEASGAADTEKSLSSEALPDSQHSDPVTQSQLKHKRPVSRRRRQTTLDKTFTRAVQLHGDLDNVVCTICHTRYPFTEKLAEEFCEGAPPPCPRCKEIEAIRDLVGKRSVASGVLRPDIVLYNEAHPQSEVIGALSEYDLKRRPDLLIVIGTSLKIPGIKRMVKEMSRCVHDCSARAKRAGAGKAIFINRDEPPRGWEDVFDIFVSGDSDQAIGLLPISSDECPTETSDTAPAAGSAEKILGQKSSSSSVTSIENLCSSDLLDVSIERSAKTRVRRRQLKKSDGSVASLATIISRKSANGLAKRSSLTRPQQQKLKQHQRQKQKQKQPPLRKLTSMLKVVKSSAVAESKRTKNMRASTRSTLGKLDIPTSPLIAPSSSPL
ncbi:NAD-dependent deacetylase hst3 [Coemansia asiatica]|uniref:NAD-dependent deacetylase hst3 n=1 Tax=Coemansia asiatica TaxID=1052880 RepID=A0A9W8CI42_9FUNG|nr:NAD-dependent deacetylase hst3 [Coemansia asiatica]